MYERFSFVGLLLSVLQLTVSALNESLSVSTSAASVTSVPTTTAIVPEPTSSLTYFTYSISTTNEQPSTSSTPDVVLTESLRPTPTQKAWPNLVLHSTGIITVAVLASLFVVTAGAALVLITAIVIYRKPNRTHLGRNNSMISNAAYGTTIGNMAATSTARRGDTYDYPRFGLRLLKSVRGKKPSGVHNNTTVAAEEDGSGNIYTMDFSSQINEAYGTSFSSLEDDLEYSYVRYM